MFGLYNIYAVKRKDDEIKVNVMVANKNINMHVDTGASLSVISEYKKHFYEKELNVLSVKLRDYQNQIIPVFGEIQVMVEHEKQQKQLPLIVVRGDRPNLMGRNWLSKICLDWSSIFTMVAISSLQDMSKLHDGEETDANIYYFSYLNELSIVSRDIRESTRKDPVMSKVLSYTLNG